ncbi:MAG: MarR family winged helix-turn-helix transcriptional regulator [Sphingobium sp.]
MTAFPKPPGDSAELEAYLPYLINRLANMGQNAQNRMLDRGSTALVVLRTLSVLHIEDGLTINEIATRTFAEQSTASRTIDALVAAGFVERRTPATDQRRREIVLMKAGRQQLFDCWPQMEEYHAMMLAGIDPNDLATCRRVLATMTENLRKA